MLNAVHKHWPFVAALAAAALLGVAHGFETFGHMAPCELCLKAREVYWVALAAGLSGAAGMLYAPRLRPWICAGLALIFASGVALAAYHTGVERHWWPGPAACTGGGGRVTAADLANFLKGSSHPVPQCDRPAFVFLGLSMASWNGVAALILTLGSVWAGRGEPVNGRTAP